MESYAEAQIHRHQAKHRKLRKIGFYTNIVSHLKGIKAFGELSSNGSYEMICMGTRNNWERDMFRYFLNNPAVLSADISPLSQADVVGDFSKFSSDWNNKMSIIYSNSLDRAPDATSAFQNWLKILKSGGIMILGFVFGDEVTEADCSSFSKERVEAFFDSCSDVDLIKVCQEYDYSHYFLEKK